MDFNICFASNTASANSFPPYRQGIVSICYKRRIFVLSRWILNIKWILTYFPSRHLCSDCCNTITVPCLFTLLYDLNITNHRYCQRSYKKTSCIFHCKDNHISECPHCMAWTRLQLLVPMWPSVALLCYLPLFWDRGRHICISILSLIVSDNGLSPAW